MNKYLVMAALVAGSLASSMSGVANAHWFGGECRGHRGGLFGLGPDLNGYYGGGYYRQHPDRIMGPFNGYGGPYGPRPDYPVYGGGYNGRMGW